jgi:hypothetical protein
MTTRRSSESTGWGRAKLASTSNIRSSHATVRDMAQPPPKPARAGVPCLVRLRHSRTVEAMIMGRFWHPETDWMAEVTYRGQIGMTEERVPLRAVIRLPDTDTHRSSPDGCTGPGWVGSLRTGHRPLRLRGHLGSQTLGKFDSPGAGVSPVPIRLVAETPLFGRALAATESIFA